MNFIASPEIVTALALAGRMSFDPRADALVDLDGAPFRLEPPKPAPEVPDNGFDPGRAAHVAPPAISLAHSFTDDQLAGFRAGLDSRVKCNT
jgi:aconitate hydratase